MNRDDDGQWFVQCRVYCILLTVLFCASYFVRYQFVSLNLNFDFLAIFSGVCMGMAAVSRRLCSKACKIEWMMQSWSRIFHIVNLVRKTVCGRKVLRPLLKIMVILTGCACFCWLELSPWSFKFYQGFVAMWSTAWMHLWDLWGSFAAFVFFHVKAMSLQTHASCVSGHAVDGFQATPGFEIPVNCVAQMVDTDFKPTWNHGLLSAVAMMSFYFVTLWQFCSTRTCKLVSWGSVFTMMISGLVFCNRSLCHVTQRPQIAEVVSAVSRWCQQFQFTGADLVCLGLSLICVRCFRQAVIWSFQTRNDASVAYMQKHFLRNAAVVLCLHTCLSNPTSLSFVFAGAYKVLVLMCGKKRIVGCGIALLGILLMRMLFSMHRFLTWNAQKALLWFCHLECKIMVIAFFFRKLFSFFCESAFDWFRG